MILSTIPRRARLARRRAQAGFTLIELMVAMVVSAIVVLGVYAFSTIQQSTAGLHERNVRVQQALEGAMWTMAQDVRSAGLGFGRLCSELRVYDAAGGRLINPGAVAAPAQAYLDQVTNEAYWVLRDGLQAHWNSSVGASMVGTLNRSSDPNSVADSFDVILAEAAYTDSYGVFELSAVVDPADGYLVVEGSGMLDNNDPNHVAQVQQLFPPGSFFLLSRTPAAATNPMRPDFQGQCPLLQVTGDVVAEPGNVRQWRIPISGAVSGFDGDVATLLEQEACTKAGGIPTIWLNFLAWLDANKGKLDLSKLKLKMIFSGGTAAPRATIQKVRDDLGIFLLHAWGMTETSPIVTLGSPLAKHENATPDEIVDMQVKQGRQVCGVELKLVGKDGETLPHDGQSIGELKVRGNWVISGYFKGEGGKVVDDDGWFGTGDVATIDPDGYVQLTDRLKDVIKSGGEWISSIEIENLALLHPDVFEAAVIAIPHPTWQERPLLLVHPKPGANPTKESILEFLSTRIAKWWMPEDVVFVESLPHTATGKLLKTELRTKYGGAVAVKG